ncbi:MAG: IS30 family transposase [Lachnospiraceae bacterium]
MAVKYFTEKERFQLELLLKEKYTIYEISKKLDKCIATIYNEKKRGTIELLNSDLTTRKEYCADYSQNLYLEKRTNKGANLKISNDYKLVDFLENKILNEHFSPYACLSYIKTHHLKFKTSICFKTLYNYIDSGLFLNISNKNLIMKCKSKNYKSHSHKSSVSLNNIKGQLNSVDSRALEVLDRDCYGNWEMDTVVGTRGGSKACLLVLSERMTRQEIVLKIADKTQKSVVDALDNLEREMGFDSFVKTFKTITVDNGAEFLNSSEIVKSTFDSGNRTLLYYCHPYSAWERGTNENINKMIRRFIPKKSDIGQYTVSQIKSIEQWINNYPRKIFNGYSSNDYLASLQLSF